MDYYPGCGLFCSQMEELTCGHHLTGSGNYSSPPVCTFLTNKVFTLHENSLDPLSTPAIAIAIAVPAYYWQGNQGGPDTTSNQIDRSIDSSVRSISFLYHDGASVWMWNLVTVSWGRKHIRKYEYMHMRNRSLCSTIM